VARIHLMMPMVSGFAEAIPDFQGTPINRSFGALCSALGRIQLGSSSFLDIVHRYILYTVHEKFDDGLFITVLRNRATMYIKTGVQNRSVFKSSNFQKPPAPTRSWCFSPTERYVGLIPSLGARYG
jgi:hypothetical protein